MPNKGTIRRAFEMLFGSLVVYLAVVACGSSGGGEKPTAANGGEPASSGGSSLGGAPSTTGGSDSGGLGFGGLPDPTPDAGAAEAGDGPGPTVCDCPEPPDPYVPPEPLVVEAECDVQAGSSTSGIMYAVIDKPTLPDAMLWLGTAVLVGYQPSAAWSAPPGHNSISQPIMVGPDTVAAPCGQYGSGSAPLPTAVRFVFPS